MRSMNISEDYKMARTIDFTLCSVCGTYIEIQDFTRHWNNHYSNVQTPRENVKSEWDTPLTDWAKYDKDKKGKK